jgi:hypothetical protein
MVVPNRAGMPVWAGIFSVPMTVTSGFWNFLGFKSFLKSEFFS